MESSSNGPSEPTARHCRRFWQFSLRDALLLLLVSCVAAAYWGEQRSHLAERRLRVDSERRVSLLQNERLGADRARLSGQKVLKITDPNKVHVKALPPGRVSREGIGWAWLAHLPPDRKWWLYVSQGERWDDAEGRYSDGATSGSQIKGGHEVTIFGCITRDLEGVAYIQNWTGDESHAARFSEDGHWLFSFPAKESRFTAGERDQETLELSSAPKGRIQLFRWHRVQHAGPTEPPKEYGFSIFLVDETPRARPPRFGGSHE